MERLDSSCASIRPGPWINGPGTLQVTRAAENQDHPDRSKLAGYGPNTADVNAVAQWALGGNATAQVCEREKISGVAVRGLEPDVVDAPNPEHEPLVERLVRQVLRSVRSPGLSRGHVRTIDGAVQVVVLGQ